MTGPGRSPPRSKKESSDVGETKDEPIAEKREPEPQPDEPRGAHLPDPADARQLREQAKQLAKERRVDAREKVRAAKAQERSEAAAVKAARRSDARATKRAAREAKAGERSSRRDRIVEAPREPRKTIGQRLRRDRSKTPPAAAVPGASKGSVSRRVASLLGVVLGVLGLMCSIILAVGALLAAKGVDETGSFYQTVSGICDVLIGPLREVVSFEGANAEMKESLVAWGAGSIAYLLAGLIAQTVLRSPADD